MYKTVIEVHKDIPGVALKALHKAVNSAFDNRAGKVCNSSDDLYTFVFQGGEQDCSCLELGAFTLKRTNGFLGYVKAWDWIDDEDPAECCNMLEVFSSPVR